jgi:hypothetical protein
MKKNKQNHYLCILLAALGLSCTAAVSAEEQYGHCVVTKYLKYRDPKTKVTIHSKFFVDIWWISHFNHKKQNALSSFGETDEYPTKYKLIGLQDRSTTMHVSGPADMPPPKPTYSDRSDWSIHKVDAEDEKDHRWQISGYGILSNVM